MIPKFPRFKKIGLQDKKHIEQFTCHFPPYSDFNFSSMWGWNVHNKILISELNNNLVVLFKDYVTDDYFLSFLGNEKVEETARELIEYSQKKYQKNFLKLIPEEVYLSLKKPGFAIKHDRNAFDYIFLVEHLAHMEHWPKSTSGKRIRNFIKQKTPYKIHNSSVNKIPPKEFKEIFKKWVINKKIDDYNSHEYKAFLRFLKTKNKNLRIISLYMKGVLAGFTLYEIVSKDYAISHFATADKNHHSAIYDLLNWEEAKYLHKKGVKYFNWEQDLGLPGLRYAKTKYRPAFLLKKLIVEPVGN
jgi:uncharacterized protein